MKSQELFPESLRIRDAENPQVYTNSRKVAVHFKQSHQQVARCIEILIKDMSGTDMDCSQYVQPVRRVDGRGTDYLLTRDGFSFVAMRLTSRAALHWKVLYIQTYQHMRHINGART